mmetsp:Transcript_107821/g.315208  ORF Transcript_107821/g.315208 Transcript_107821/m.315208 type:complete len:264 (+) Transcript_107821:611-1402(+)
MHGRVCLGQQLPQLDGLQRIGGARRVPRGEELVPEAREGDGRGDLEGRLLEAGDVLNQRAFGRIVHIVVANARAPTLDLAMSVGAGGVGGAGAALGAVPVHAAAPRLVLHYDAPRHDEGTRGLYDWEPQVRTVKDLVARKSLPLKLGDDSAYAASVLRVQPLHVEDVDDEVHDDKCDHEPIEGPEEFVPYAHNLRRPVSADGIPVPGAAVGAFAAPGLPVPHVPLIFIHEAVQLHLCNCRCMGRPCPQRTAPASSGLNELPWL